MTMSTEVRRSGPKKGQVYKKRRPYEVVMCPHCLTEGKGTVMARWHFDRCASRAVTEKNYIEGEEDERTKD